MLSIASELEALPDDLLAFFHTGLLGMGGHGHERSLNTITRDVMQHLAAAVKAEQIRRSGDDRYKDHRIIDLRETPADELAYTTAVFATALPDSVGTPLHPIYASVLRYVANLSTNH